MAFTPIQIIKISGDNKKVIFQEGTSLTSQRDLIKISEMKMHILNDDGLSNALRIKTSR